MKNLFPVNYDFPEVTTKKLQLKRMSVTQKIELEEAKPEEPEQKVTFKITKKKKSVTEMELKTEPEKEPEAFKVQLKKRKKKKVHQAQEVEERVPVEEVTEFSGTPTEVIEFIDVEEGLAPTEVTTEGAPFFTASSCFFHSIKNLNKVLLFSQCYTLQSGKYE